MEGFVLFIEGRYKIKIWNENGKKLLKVWRWCGYEY